MQENKWKNWDVKKSSYWHDCSGQFTEEQYKLIAEPEYAAQKLPLLVVQQPYLVTFKAFQ